MCIDCFPFVFVTAPKDKVKCIQDVLVAEVESVKVGMKTGGTHNHRRSSCDTSVQHIERRDSSIREKL